MTKSIERHSPLNSLQMLNFLANYDVFGEDQAYSIREKNGIISHYLILSGPLITRNRSFVTVCGYHCRTSWLTISLDGLLGPSCVRSPSATSTRSLAADSAQHESCAGVRFKVIKNATYHRLFMETGEKIALSRTVKHGVLSLFLIFLG